MNGCGRHRRPLKARTEGQLAGLERAFEEVWAQRAWDPARPETPLGLCFRSAEEWRTWRARVHNSSPDIDLLTLASCPPVVAVFFVGPDGQWLDAVTIEDLIALAYSGHAERGHRTMEAVRSMQPASGSHRKSETEQCPCQVSVNVKGAHLVERDAHAPV